MTDRNRGLIGKYRVERADGKPINWCFTLEDTDPLAVPALLAYMEAAADAGYVNLAYDLESTLIHWETHEGKDSCADCGWLSKAERNRRFR